MKSCGSILLAIVTITTLSLATPPPCCIQFYDKQAVKCSHRGLTSMSNVTGPKSEAIYLFLHHNRIRLTSNKDFEKFGPKLKHLYLQDNNINTLPTGIFDKLTALKTLYLYNNKITALPTGIFDKLTALEILNLYKNEITALPTGIFDKLTALGILLLHDNQITSLPDGVFSKLTHLKTLDVEANPFQNMDCEQFCGRQVLYDNDNPKYCFGKTFSDYCQLGHCMLSNGTTGLGKGTNSRYRVGQECKAVSPYIYCPGDGQTFPVVEVPNFNHVVNTTSCAGYQLFASVMMVASGEAKCNVKSNWTTAHNICAKKNMSIARLHGQTLSTLYDESSYLECLTSFLQRFATAQGVQIWTGECSGDKCEILHILKNDPNSSYLSVEDVSANPLHLLTLCEIALPSTPKALFSGAIAGIVAGLGINLVVVSIICYKRNHSRKQEESISNGVYKNIAVAGDGVARLLSVTLPHELESRKSMAVASAGLSSVTLPHELDFNGYVAVDSSAGLLSITLPHEH